VPNIKKIRGLNLPGTPWTTSACCGRPLPFSQLEVLSYRDFNNEQIQFVDKLEVLLSLESLYGRMEKQKGDY
jgi:hypothetical protein